MIDIAEKELRIPIRKIPVQSNRYLVIGYHAYPPGWRPEIPHLGAKPQENTFPYFSACRADTVEFNVLYHGRKRILLPVFCPSPSGWRDRRSVIWGRCPQFRCGSLTGLPGRNFHLANTWLWDECNRYHPLRGSAMDDVSLLQSFRPY